MSTQPGPNELDVTEWLDFRPHFTEASRGLTVSAKMPDALVREMDRLINTEGVPYRTRSDFLRDACWAAVCALQQKLQLHDLALISVIRSEQARAASEDLMRKEEQARETVGKRIELAERLWSLGEQEEVIRLLNDLIRVVRSLPIAADRRFYTREIRSRSNFAIIVQELLRRQTDIDPDYATIYAGDEVSYQED